MARKFWESCPAWIKYDSIKFCKTKTPLQRGSRIFCKYGDAYYPATIIDILLKEIFQWGIGPNMSFWVVKRCKNWNTWFLVVIQLHVDFEIFDIFSFVFLLLDGSQLRWFFIKPYVRVVHSCCVTWITVFLNSSENWELL